MLRLLFSTRVLGKKLRPQCFPLMVIKRLLSSLHKGNERHHCILEIKTDKHLLSILINAADPIHVVPHRKIKPRIPSTENRQITLPAHPMKRLRINPRQKEPRIPRSEEHTSEL